MLAKENCSFFLHNINDKAPSFPSTKTKKAETKSGFQYLVDYLVPLSTYLVIS